jgi:DNA repair protein RadC
MYIESPERKGGGCLIAEMSEHERPRERMQQVGPDSLSDSELLAILLRTGTRGRSALDLARDLLRAFGGNLNGLAKATLTELRTLHGIGGAKALEISAAFTLARRLASQAGPGLVRIQGPMDVVNLLREKLRLKSQEEFHVLLLDTKHHVLRDECVTVGLADRSQIHAREVFRPAIRESCSAVILAHNHPSGDPTPSPQDLDCTKALVAAGRLIGINVLDHVVIGRPNPAFASEFVSFREANLL